MNLLLFIAAVLVFVIVMFFVFRFFEEDGHYASPRTKDLTEILFCYIKEYAKVETSNVWVMCCFIDIDKVTSIDLKKLVDISFLLASDSIDEAILFREVTSEDEIKKLIFDSTNDMLIHLRFHKGISAVVTAIEMIEIIWKLRKKLAKKFEIKLS